METGTSALTDAAAPAARRSDAGTVRLTSRDVAGLVLAGEMHAAAPAITALRTRIVARFTELEAERADITNQLTALAAPDSDHSGDPALLDELPHLAGLLIRAPIRLQQQLYDAFSLQLLYSKKHHRVTIRATITRTTPGTVEAIISDSHAVSYLSQPPMRAKTVVIMECGDRPADLPADPGAALDAVIPPVDSRARSRKARGSWRQDHHSSREAR
jgi:hypothetical protein